MSRLTEVRNEADAILSAAQCAPTNPLWQQLSGEEQLAITLARDRLGVIKQGEDITAIRNAIHGLDQVTRRYSELMIEAAVQSARRGGN